MVFMKKDIKKNNNFVSSLAVAGLLPLLLTAQRECTMFKKEYCNMQVSVISIIICIIVNTIIIFMFIFNIRNN